MQLQTTAFDITKLGYFDRNLDFVPKFEWKNINITATAANQRVWKYGRSQLGGSVLSAHGCHLFTPWH